MAGSALDAFRLHYEDMPVKKPVRVGRTFKMSKQTKVTAPKEAKSYNKTRGEHFKDIVIAILIVGVVAFALGVRYSENKNAEMQSAVKAAQVTAQTTEAKK